MNMVCMHGTSVTFASPISHQLTTLLGLLYMDNNCDLFTVDTDGTQPMENITKLQMNINLWQGGLTVTEGALSPVKFLWCLLAMRLHRARWNFHTTTSLPATLTVMDSNHLPQLIWCLNPQEGIAVIGVVQLLLGSQKPALLTILTKANKWETAIRQGYLPCPLAWLALHCVIWPALQYPLMVTSFSKQQVLLITGRLYCTLLPCLGINWNDPLALWHIPIKYQGLSLPHPFWEQGIVAIHIFLELSNTSCPESILLQTSLEYLQLEIRTGCPLFQADFHHWGPLATLCWLKLLWGFAQEAQISLHLAKTYIPAPQQE